MHASQENSLLPVGMDEADEASLGRRREITEVNTGELESRKMAASKLSNIHKLGSNPAARAALSSVAAQLRNRWASGAIADAGTIADHFRSPS